MWIEAPSDVRNGSETVKRRSPAGAAASDESRLTLAEYLAMQQAIGHPTRVRILRTLVANDEYAYL